MFCKKRTSLPVFFYFIITKGGREKPSLDLSLPIVGLVFFPNRIKIAKLKEKSLHALLDSD